MRLRAYEDVTPEWRLTLPSHIKNGDLVVPPGSIFAMGDNRDVCLDSRYWGFVPRENVIGRPMFIYWSFITPRDEYQRQIGDRIAGCSTSYFISSTRPGGHGCSTWCINASAVSPPSPALRRRW